MSYRKPHIRPSFATILGGLLFFFFFNICSPLLAQNTKGDRPSSNRESRFRAGSKKKKSQGSAKRIRSRSKSNANSGSRTRPRSSTGRKERAGKPLKPVYSVKPSNEKQRAWRGDITGRRVRTKNKSSASTYVHPQNGGGLVKRRVKETEGQRNVYPQTGKYVGGYSRKPKDRRPIYSGTQVRGDGRVPPPSDRRLSGGGQRGRVAPRSATRSYISHKSINIYARFARPKPKGERATTKDLAGRKLRTRNFQTRGPGLIKAIRHPSQVQKRAGDRPYSGRSYSGYLSTSRSGKAWRGDVAHNRLRYRNRSSKGSARVTVGGKIQSRLPRSKPYASRGALSATRKGKSKTGTSPVPVKTPGIGGQIGGFQGRLKRTRSPMRDQGEGFTGFRKSQRPLKGGGSRSGRKWNNGGVPIQVRGPGNNIDVGGFRGRIKGGGRRMVDQGEAFSGVKKSRKPLKGGGSVSGRLWNNSESSLPRRTLGGDISGIPANLRRKRTTQVDQGEEFTGVTKARRPLKGGGSVSGKLFNNNETPLPRKTIGGDISGIPANLRRKRTVQVDQGEEFTGVIKARRPVKGGGSVSGKLWNNNETPIQRRTPSESASRALQYSGNTKVNLLRNRFRDQGEEFTGYIKRSKRSYTQNENAAEESLKKKRPGKSVFDVDGLQVKVERRDYIRNKNAAEDALLKLRPTKTTNQVGELHVRVKQYRYVRNPSSARESLKVREPGKAFARATDYQGNIKMKKFSFFDRNRAQHPDTRFIKTNKNNVDEERDLLTNFKLWWARLFKKQEAQPEHLKEKGRKPRYDSGEQGMWYD